MTDQVATPAAPAVPATSATAGLLGDAVQPTATPAPAPADPAAAPAAAPTEPAPAPEGMVKMPGKDATPEQWAEFYKAIGAPESADAYQLPVPEGDTGEFAKTAAEWFKEAGILPKQAEALATKWNEYQAQFMAEQTKAVEAAETARLQALDTKNKAEAEALKTEWGQAHEANAELAKRAVRQFLPQDQAADILTALEDKIGYAGVMKFMHSLGKRLGEDNVAGLGEPQQGQGRDMSFEGIAARMYGKS